MLKTLLYKWTPARILIVTTVCVFAAETIIMILLSVLPPMGTWTTIFIDASLIVVLVLPVLYRLFYKSLQQSVFDRSQSEESLHSSEGKFRSYVDSSPYAVIVVDKDGSIIDVNAAAVKISGYSISELLKMNLKNLFAQSDESAGMEHFNRVLATGRSSGVVSIIIKSGAKRHWEIEAVMLGENRFLGYISDVTNRIETEEALKLSEKKFRTLVEYNNVIPWRFDLKENRFTFVGPQVKKILGFPVESWTDFDSWKNSIHPDDRQCVVDLCMSATEKGEDHDFEYRCVNSKGEIVWLRDIVTVRSDEQGVAFELIGYKVDITPLKRAEDKLRKSEYKLLEAQKIARLAYYVFDVKTGDWTGSPELLTIFGIDNGYKKDLEGWQQVVHPEDRETMLEYLYDDVLSQHQKFDREYRIIDSTTGQEKWVHGLGRLKFDENGKPVELFGTIQDITERRQTEKALRESEERFRTIYENAPVFINAFNESGGCVLWNKQCREIFGWTIDEINEHKDALELFYPDPAIRDKVQRSVTTNPDGRFRKQHPVTKDGRTLSTMWANFRLPDGMVFNLGYDITEREQTEKAFKESESKYRTLFEQSADAILIIEGDQFVDCNLSTVKMLGYKNKKELLKTHPSELSPETQPDGKSSFAKANEMMSIAFNQGSHRFEWEHRRHNGEIFPVEVLLTAVPFGARNFLHVVWRDITERKRLEELESRAAKLELAGTIAGQVAHDFNNLLAPIMAYPELIRDELSHNHNAHAYLDDIENAAKKIAEINQDLLTMGRRGHYSQEVIDLNKIVLHAIKDMKLRIKTVTIEADLCGVLMKIKGGGAQLHRMLTNLLVNAEDAIEGVGQISIRTENYYADTTLVAFGCVPKGEYVKLTIKDNGCGIPDSMIQKILDPFFSTKAADKKRGSGLGLSIVDAVVKDHNGYLDLSSKVGQGTSFYLYFPVTREIAGGGEFGRATGGSEKILVVDDDDVQRKVTSQLLKKLGYEINSVRSGDKAIEVLLENPHDLVILDMVMPNGIDGAETYRLILEYSPNQKAIILSGFSESDRVLEAQKLGAGAFIRKPVTKQTIAAAVRTELDRRVREIISN